MFIFAGRLGLAFALAALCLGGRMAHAQVAPLPYWVPSWPFGFGSNLTPGQSSNTYGNFSSFAGGDFSYTRYNLPNGWFGVAEGSGMGLAMNGINQYAAFDNFRSLSYEGVQFGYDFQSAGGLPFKVYAGFDTLNVKDIAGVGGAFTTSDTMSGALSAHGTRAGIEFQPAPNVSLSLGVGYTQFGR
ncbi:MAG: hypothetical protein J2P54_13615 [Bradyrhizobiaceae bacterium]|nr:hypothetical protein [Bradyrhizobiaceae bacterium]